MAFLMTSFHQRVYFSTKLGLLPCDNCFILYVDMEDKTSISSVEGSSSLLPELP